MTPCLRISAVALPLAALLGCTNLSGLGGQSSYACRAPEGVSCNSVSGNYANAVQNNLPSQRENMSPPTGAAPVDTPAIASRGATRTPAIGATPELAPLRSRSRLIRLWIAPWEDADGDLYDQGYVYVQIDHGQWLIDHLSQQIQDDYLPLRPPEQREPDESSPAPASAGSPAPVSPSSVAPGTPVFPLSGMPELGNSHP